MAYFRITRLGAWLSPCHMDAQQRQGWAGWGCRISPSGILGRGRWPGLDAGGCSVASRAGWAPRSGPPALPLHVGPAALCRTPASLNRPVYRCTNRPRPTKCSSLLTNTTPVFSLFAPRSPCPVAFLVSCRSPRQAWLSASRTMWPHPLPAHPSPQVCFSNPFWHHISARPSPPPSTPQGLAGARRMEPHRRGTVGAWGWRFGVGQSGQ